MYVLAVLIMVKIYQSRHPDINARAHATFGVLAVLIAFGTHTPCFLLMLDSTNITYYIISLKKNRLFY